ncbi:hypothetical protein LEP1GSC166_4054 [Leptospira kirschneri]|nr:hypothetical protein LEP1GSC166_4054 [Leptospira kirschneri]
MWGWLWLSTDRNPGLDFLGSQATGENLKNFSSSTPGGKN